VAGNRRAVKEAQSMNVGLREAYDLGRRFGQILREWRQLKLELPRG